MSGLSLVWIMFWDNSILAHSSPNQDKQDNPNEYECTWPVHLLNKAHTIGHIIKRRNSLHLRIHRSMLSIGSVSWYSFSFGSTR